MHWVTRCHVRVDPVACSWLIRRFVDPQAQISIAPLSIAMALAKDGAIPFDLPGAELGHCEGRCSFESILLKYHLTDFALHRMACIIHSADFCKEQNPDPVARGLSAIDTGFHLSNPCDDKSNLSLQIPIYDALYAWCCLEADKYQDRIDD